MRSSISLATTSPWPMVRYAVPAVDRWKEERHGVFIDYNQNAKDRTVASAYSVRPTPDARVSAPLAWDEVEQCNPADFTLASMPARYAESGDLHAAIDAHAGSIAGLLELFERQGLGDAPWPPHRHRERGRDANVLEHTAIVIQPK